MGAGATERAAWGSKMVSQALDSKYVRVALRSWWLLLLCAGIAGVVAFTTTTRKPVFEATATLVVGRSLQGNPTEANLQGSHLLALTYADLALRQPVLQRVAEKLDVGDGWHDLQGRVEPNTIIDTPFLEITAKASSATEAQTIANEVARQLVEIQASVNRPSTEGPEREQFVRDQLHTLEVKIGAAENQVADAQSALSKPLPPDQERSLKGEVRSLEQLITSWQNAYATLAGFLQDAEQELPQLSILSPALADLTPRTPERYRNTAIAALIGLLFGVVVVTVLDRLRDTVKSQNDVTEELGLTLLGAVRRVGGPRSRKRPFTVEGSSVRAAEDYRIIRSNIMFASDSQAVRSILVTSPPGSGGRSTTVANLGSVMARAGLRTVLLDADLRRPTLHELFGLPRTPGLGDFLRSSDLDIKDIKFSTPIENVHVITSGAPLHNPSDWLDSPRMTALLASLTTAADVVIIDSPPMLAVADAVELATHVDGVLLVLDAGQTGRENALKSVAALRFTGARILGAVLNRVPNWPTYAYAATHAAPTVGPISKVEEGTDSS